MGGDLARRLAERRKATVAIDAGRMRRERHARLQTEMARQGIDVALLLHGPNVAYATGHSGRGIDATHAVFERPVAVVVAGQDQSHLYRDIWPELDEGAARLSTILADVAGSLVGHRVAVDELTGAIVRAGLLGRAKVVEASPLIGAAKLTKTADELACIAAAQWRNEAAMVAVQQAAVPGVRRSQVAGAFLAALRGRAANLIDPIFQPMPRAIADGPRTTTGHVAFPTGVGDPTFTVGDLVWVDTGIDHLGYASDFGRTWLIGRDPTPAEQHLFERWCAVMVAVLDALGPGVAGGELCRVAQAANGGERPWLPHFYLAHGVGVESAEMPLIGTDLGPEFDDQLVMAPGMVLVLEPVIWDDGIGGYRAEEIVAVTDDGWCHLGSGHPYAPFAP